ncbi:hypothetical protein E4T56_gene11157 [Termitomyces sp. T112]|nr:hypothetical protein E4T56_gene11157 [Termitomyces sp. T112]
MEPPELTERFLYLFGSPIEQQGNGTNADGKLATQIQLDRLRVESFSRTILVQLALVNRFHYLYLTSAQGIFLCLFLDPTSVHATTS